MKTIKVEWVGNKLIAGATCIAEMQWSLSFNRWNVWVGTYSCHAYMTRDQVQVWIENRLGIEGEDSDGKDTD